VSARGETGPRVIRLYTLGAGTAVLHREFVPPQVYPPQWAAVALDKDVLSMAVTKPGGASSQLLHWRSDQAAAAAMNSSDTFRVFKAPRAVRQHGGLIGSVGSVGASGSGGSSGSSGSSGANGSNGPHRRPMFVAIERRAGAGIVTLFSAGADGQWTEQALFQGPAVADPVLAQLGAGWLLLYKTADGAGAGEATRSRQRGTAGPATLGQVHGLRLDAQFKATAPGFVLSSGGPVYEFDADLAGERLVVLGTTPEGYSLAEWRLTPDGIVLEKRADAALPAAAGAPAVLLKGQVVHLTVIESIGTAAGRVVHGQR
jgi:hypothetical protein